MMNDCKKKSYLFFTKGLKKSFNLMNTACKTEMITHYQTNIQVQAQFKSLQKENMSDLLSITSLRLDVFVGSESIKVFIYPTLLCLYWALEHHSSFSEAIKVLYYCILKYWQSQMLLSCSFLFGFRKTRICFSGLGTKQRTVKCC